MYSALKELPEMKDITISLESKKKIIVENLLREEMLPHEASLSKSKFAKTSSTSLSHAMILCLERSDSDLR